jgi:NAD(P)-dependent dehydrogenase (short-subunit alcohol dehydrogenase family)
MAVDLTDRVGLVTGGASGIGRASVLALAAAGATVVVVDRPEQADAAADVVREAGRGSRFVAADVTSADDWETVIAATLDISGRLDFAHNNAGIGHAASLLEVGLDDFERVMRVNTTGVWLGLQAELRVMSAQGSGAIVNTASLAALRGLDRGAVYSASKHAVVGLTKSAAIEFAPQEIRVNAICPAATDTAMTRDLPDDIRAMLVAPQVMRRFADPSEIGAVVAWLCSDASTFITGAAIPVDGGASAT